MFWTNFTIKKGFVQFFFSGSLGIIVIEAKMLAFNTPCRRGGRVRLGVEFPMVRNGNVLLRVCDVWVSRPPYEKPLASSRSRNLYFYPGSVRSDSALRDRFSQISIDP